MNGNLPNESKHLLSRLCLINGTSGTEELVQEFIVQTIRPFVDDVYVDLMGNVVAHKRGNGKRLMLVAHSDEVGLMVTYVDAEGFLHCRSVGCVDATVWAGREVEVIHEGKSIAGIIGRKPYQLQHLDVSSSAVSINDLWIDIGAKDKKEAMTQIALGDYVYPASSFTVLQNDKVSSKALDDRVGVYTLLEVAKRLSSVVCPYDIYYVFSVQEELGGRGAVVAANAIKPDICLVVDVTHAADYPTMNPLQLADISLGSGCVLGKGANIDHALFAALQRIAATNEMMCQIEPLPYPSGTDGNGIQISNGGVRTALVSIPCRYMHTPNEVVSLLDVEGATTLLELFCQDPNSNPYTLYSSDNESTY